MAKHEDALHQFTGIRRALEQERITIRTRLAQIDAALFQENVLTQPAPSPKRTVRKPNSKPRLTMREAITRATTEKSLSVGEIVPAIQKLGYEFRSDRPNNSVGAYLYGAEGRKHFKRVDGKFAPLKKG